MKKGILFLLLALNCNLIAADIINVDLSKVLSHPAANSIGINLNYLRDDNNNLEGARPIQETLKEMGVGWLRYPGGEKSDRHLWSQPPWNEPDPQVKGSYLNQVKDILDFDEYIEYAKQAGAEPYVVVGYGRENRTGFTKRQYLENAIEWVKYANVKNNYGVKYWEIGNENWNNNTATPKQMAEIVVEFSRAMKAVDPSIKVGSSNGRGAGGWSDFFTIAGQDVDFLVNSNYLKGTWDGFSKYRDNTKLNFIQNGEALADAINQYAPESKKDDMFVVLAELNAKNWAGAWQGRNDLGHALVTAEIFGQMLMNDKIRMGALWTTRWMKINESDNVFHALGPKNEILPAGRAVAIWGQFLNDRMVEISRPDKLVTFASLDSRTGKLSLFITNKDNQAHELDIDIAGSTKYESAEVFEFSGNGSEDLNPIWEQKKSISISDNRIRGYQAAETSFTVLSLTSKNFISKIKSPVESPDKLRLADIRKGEKTISFEIEHGAFIPEYDGMAGMELYTVEGQPLYRIALRRDNLKFALLETKTCSES